MAKKKVISQKTESREELKQAETPKIQPINDLNPLVYSADDIAAFERLDNLFHVHEDNWAVSQDATLLNLIQSENGVSESQAMRYLLRLYRNLQREINNC